jgi:hypothetical protein
MLQSYGVVYVGRVVNRASEINSVIGFVLGLLAYIYLVVVVFVLAAEVNVTRTRRLWPRALLTPFTDDVDLTDADVMAYGDQARAQRTKGYESIEVRFRRPPADGA